MTTSIEIRSDGEVIVRSTSCGSRFLGGVCRGRVKSSLRRLLAYLSSISISISISGSSTSS